MNTIKINDKLNMNGGFMRIPNVVYGLLANKELGLKPVDLVVYATMLNRLSLSFTNADKFNNNGEMYVVYEQKELMKELSLSNRGVSDSIKRLDGKLIKVSRHGKNKPNTYAFYDVFNMTLPQLTLQIVISGDYKMSPHDITNCHGSNTDISNTDINNIKRYTVLENGGFLTQQYAKVYQRFKNKKHPDMTAEDLEEVELNLSEFVQENSVDEFELLQAIELYFETLPTKNNGHIKAFAMKDLNGPLNRLIT